MYKDPCRPHIDLESQILRVSMLYRILFILLKISQLHFHLVQEANAFSVFLLEKSVWHLQPTEPFKDCRVGLPGSKAKPLWQRLPTVAVTQRHWLGEFQFNPTYLPERVCSNPDLPHPYFHWGWWRWGGMVKLSSQSHFRFDLGLGKGALADSIANIY